MLIKKILFCYGLFFFLITNHLEAEKNNHSFENQPQEISEKNNTNFDDIPEDIQDAANRFNEEPHKLLCFFHIGEAVHISYRIIIQSMNHFMQQINSYPSFLRGKSVLDKYVSFIANTLKKKDPMAQELTMKTFLGDYPMKPLYSLSAEEYKKIVLNDPVCKQLLKKKEK